MKILAFIFALAIASDHNYINLIFGRQRHDKSEPSNNNLEQIKRTMAARYAKNGNNLQVIYSSLLYLKETLKQ